MSLAQGDKLKSSQGGWRPIILYAWIKDFEVSSAIPKPFLPNVSKQFAYTTDDGKSSVGGAEGVLEPASSSSRTNLPDVQEPKPEEFAKVCIARCMYIFSSWRR
jgi:hypothetical protein